MVSRRVQALLDQLRAQGIQDEQVLNALAAVPREKFVDEAFEQKAWDNIALPIGQGQTISQPYMVARMTELLELTPQSRVLEIGTGSGYQTAILAHLVQHGHRVDGLGKIEHGADRLIDLPVLPEIEILRLQRFDHLGHAPLVDKDGAQHRLFRLHRVGHLAGEQFVHVRSPLSSLVDAARWAGLISPRSPPR